MMILALEKTMTGLTKVHNTDLFRIRIDYEDSGGDWVPAFRSMAMEEEVMEKLWEARTDRACWFRNGIFGMIDARISEDLIQLAIAEAGRKLGSKLGEQWVVNNIKGEE